MKRGATLLVGSGFIASAIGAAIVSLPQVVEATNASNYVISGTKSVIELPSGVEAFITPVRDPQRATFYEKAIKCIDKNSSNRLYKVAERGYMYWSPVRQKIQGLVVLVMGSAFTKTCLRTTIRREVI